MIMGSYILRGLFVYCAFVLSAYSSPVVATSLSGIKAISVLVENLPKQAVGFGVTKEFLKQTVEYLLKQQGVSIAGPQYPYLYVNIMIIDTATGGFAYKCSLALKERTVVQRLPQEWTPATTWERHSLGVTPKAQLVTSLRDCAVSLTQTYLLELTTPPPVLAPPAGSQK